MKPDGLLPCLQEPASSLYPQEINPLHALHTISLNPHCNAVLMSTFSLQSGRFLLGCWTKTLHLFIICPMRATCFSRRLFSMELVSRIKERLDGWII
jgi:hypothetical protein